MFYIDELQSLGKQIMLRSRDVYYFFSFTVLQENELPIKSVFNIELQA